MRIRIAVCLTCIVSAAWLGGHFLSADDDSPAVEKISVDDLASGKAVVIGRLGVPLMTTVTIRGTWHRPAPLSKDYSPRFHIEEVDGKKLDEPVRFHQGVVSVSRDYREQSQGKALKPRDGETWELIARESGHFHFEPDPTMQQAIWSAGRFHTELSGVLRTPETEKQDSERRKRLKAEKGKSGEYESDRKERLQTEKGKHVLKISVDDLASGKSVVIGRLGVPLMTTITVQGTWHLRGGKGGGSGGLDVEEAGGNALKEPIRFLRALVRVSAGYREQSQGKELKPRDGETWELIAHESGHFHPEPDPTMQQANWSLGRFQTELSGVLRTPETEKHESERRERIKAGYGDR